MITAPDNIKKTIIEDYAMIALRATAIGNAEQRKTICKSIYDDIDSEYRSFTGYRDEANLGLGCGFPFKYGEIKKGEFIVDLGCGAGIDSFIAAAITGEFGFVTGIDLTPDLIERAIQIKKNNVISNVDFKQGDIENIPMHDSSCDVIISNGVFSLLPDLKKVFNEMHRILKPGGRFCISDITRFGNISDSLYSVLLEFTGCLNGISTSELYCDTAMEAGFINIQIPNERILAIPDHILAKDVAEVKNDVADVNGLKIITITGNKKK